VRFWDSSALLPIFVQEQTSAAVAETYAADSAIVAWWGTPLECASALARLEREGALEFDDLTAALESLAEFADAWHEVQPVPAVRQTAMRLLRVHDLRAADALQLGAALTFAEGQPDALGFVTLDDRLAKAAVREGFPVVQPRDP
jgi:predicted nucleic acid-binding protein